MKDIYSKLYKETDYGLSKNGRCPGVRYYAHYNRFLKGKIIDFGCGRGDTVRYLRKRGHMANGLDYIDYKNDMIQWDITKFLDLTNFQTAICCDVLEHLTEREIRLVLANMSQCETTVITIHTGPSFCDLLGVDLHLTQKPLEFWVKTVSSFFNIIAVKPLMPKRWMIIGKSK